MVEDLKFYVCKMTTEPKTQIDHHLQYGAIITNILICNCIQNSGLCMYIMDEPCLAFL